MNDLWRNLPYTPHVGQAEIHAADARFKLAVAGARFGKSLSGAREMLRDTICGNGRGWVVAPLYALVRPEFSYLAHDAAALAQLRTVRTGGRDGYSRLTTCCGGEILGLSAHSPFSLLGEELDWLILCEAAHLEREAWERYLRPRLGTRLGRMVASSTPRGGNWMHELYVRATDGRDWARFHYATWDNPGITPQEIEAARRALPADVFDEQYGGQFMPLSGRVFPEFCVATHTGRLEAPPGCRVTRGIDFGFTNPMAVVWVAEDGDGRLLVLREFYRAGMIVEQAAAEIARIDEELRAEGLVIGMGYADPSGPAHIATLCENGLPTARAAGGVAHGIDLVRAALKTRPDGTPGLRIDSGCANLIREMEAYSWHEGDAENEKQPDKRRDHAVDALRYAVAGLRHGVRVRVSNPA
ncbi:MAG: hypothetical protein HS108_10255 [Planctomycetes bacterium]|nr:hypothetical protein [Planctomycetota bacterium]MCL4729337.1 hypothetical protein [Planctomycetota bacterium]